MGEEVNELPCLAEASKGMSYENSAKISGVVILIKGSREP